MKVGLNRMFSANFVLHREHTNVKHLQCCRDHRWEALAYINTFASAKIRHGAFSVVGSFVFVGLFCSRIDAISLVLSSDLHFCHCN